MKKIFSIILVALTFLSIVSTSQASSPNSSLWALAGFSEDFKDYLYIPDLREAKKIYSNYSSRKIVRVWIYSIKNDQTYSKILEEFDLTSRRSRIIEIIRYDKNGRVIASSTYPYPEWDSVVPETVGETNYETVIAWARY